MCQKQTFSLYLHIPYCERKCPYCDFNVHVSRKIPEREYTEGLIIELQNRSQEEYWVGRELQSIYFGGGTPSIFSAASIKEIISVALSLFPSKEGIEISLEANPETLNQKLLKDLNAAGLNRLSLGAQSFNDKALKLLGRRHAEIDIKRSVEKARSAGFENLNIDLIFGIPAETRGLFEEDLNKVLLLSPDHVSLYGLTIEEGTPFFRDFKNGELKLPDEDESAWMMERGRNLLKASGFHHYEISNFALPGKESRHNLSYWNGSSYLGIGAGAHSFIRHNREAPYGLRWANYSDPKKYIAKLRETNSVLSWREILSLDDARFEFFFMGLRKISGVSMKEYDERFSRNLVSDYEEVLNKLKENRLMQISSDYMLSLSDKGILLADSVIGEFAPTRHHVGTTVPTP